MHYQLDQQTDPLQTSLIQDPNLHITIMHETLYNGGNIISAHRLLSLMAVHPRSWIDILSIGSVGLR